MESEKWSGARLADYQDEQLRALVKHAYEMVSF